LSAFQQHQGAIEPSSATGYASTPAQAAVLDPRIEESTHQLARTTEPSVLRADPPHVSDAASIAASPPSEESAATAVDSVLAQFQRAMAEGIAPRATTQARPSRREQTAKAAEHPFVRRAMELFEAAPDKLRYTPPDETQ
jgi:hypothetical protein